MTLKGVAKGKVIELEKPLPFPDGTEVEVTVRPTAGEARKNSPRAWLQLMGSLTEEEAEAILKAVREQARKVEHEPW